ncbi:hypothetical protein SERLA73DRAFT_69215 [Serpula lacrymans var. lacrymans S7.3]|uniref:RING-type domain-containing protein n=2 Tax=Serpula lacrymans var. lacrymans TaxID=341189 RepID=F8PKJ3_SERL3|nr:hypothetical protein SERLA73DRAFT_69215 [Serpula lacrymans var. lacrymans S7.3]
MEAATTTANTSSQNTVTPTGQQNPHPRRNTRNRYANRARNQTNQPGDSAGQPQDSSTSDNNRPPRKTGESQRPRRPPRSHDLPSRPVIAPHASSSNQQDVSREQSIESGAPRHTQNRGKLPTSNNAGETTSPATGETQSYPPTRPRTGRRGAKFGAGLTEPSEKTTDSPSSSITKKNHPKRKPSPPSARPDDLTSNLIHAMRTPPYPDCAICFSGIHPAQPTWSCSPSLILPQGTDSPQQNTPDNGTAQCCWTTFHLKCIRSWAAKSVKDLEDAWRARGETRKGEWRCPGCQFKREAVPTVYK